ncbi:MAG: hypothetical protein APF84_04655 [Gracilibacter sp. BRH_c7a]|nr:MAG: hypothetical protein APF84_04655 [Gracilibacter sp. BRH_c7a]
MYLKKTSLIIVTAVLFLILSVPVFGADTPMLKVEDRGLSNPNGVIMDQGEAPDYKNSIGDIQAYINENIDDELFASLHIDRDKDGKEIVVLSFTQVIEASQKKDILALADNPSLIVFRTVDFSEKDLAQKQKEIDQSWKSFEEKGIKIYTTAVNVFKNRVEIGINPYNEETIAEIHQAFGREMIDIIQGDEVFLLEDSNQDAEKMADSQESLTAAQADSPNLFQRIALFFTSIAKWILQ